MSGLLERRPVYNGRIVRLSVDRVRFPDGREGELEFVRHAGASAVVPFLDPPDHPDPRILLLRQYRYAAGGPLYEVPAGMPDGPGESWEEVARRELEEETGRRAAAFRYLTRIFTTPGFTDEVIHIFAAEGLAEGTSAPDHDEYLEVLEVPLSEAVDLVQRGELVDAKSVAAILYAHVFRGVWPAEDRRPPIR